MHQDKPPLGLIRKCLLAVIFCFAFSSFVFAQTYFVERAIDGDTIVLSTGEHVRLIGVDTPESRGGRKLNRDSERTGLAKSTIKRLGKRAKAFTKKMIEGREVNLEFGDKLHEIYGRYLAYVYRLPDRFFLNAELIKQGMATAYTKFPFKYRKEFESYEQTAKQERKGIWKTLEKDKS